MHTIVALMLVSLAQLGAADALQFFVWTPLLYLCGWRLQGCHCRCCCCCCLLPIHNRLFAVGAGAAVAFVCATAATTRIKYIPIYKCTYNFHVCMYLQQLQRQPLDVATAATSNLVRGIQLLSMVSNDARRDRQKQNATTKCYN